jgi:ABC-type lipoprotein release transport system permease subunit
MGGSTAVLMRTRTELRARFTSMLALTLLVGLGSGAVMTLAAGARRTDSAYSRFARQYDAADVIVNPAFGSQFAALDFTKVSALPQVAAVSRQHLVGVSDPNVTVFSGDSAGGTTVDRFKVLEGEQPRSDSLDEAMVGFDYARRAHLRVGSTLTLRFGVTFTQLIPVTLRIVGIEATPGEIPPPITEDGVPLCCVVRITPALYRSLIAKHVFSLDFLFVRLKHGTSSYKDFNAALNELANGKPQLNQSLAPQADNVQRSIHLQAVALWIVGALVALVVVLIFSQLLSRQATLDATESPTLVALGMTRWQIWLSGMGRIAAIGAGGALTGILAAYLASPLMPIGTARVVDTRSGLAFDALVLALAAAVVIVIVLALAAWPVWKSTRAVALEQALSERPSIVSRTAAAPGLTPPASTGIRHALETGRGPTMVPVRSSLLSVILAIVALTGALTFGASLDHLLSTPRLYGWNWDAHLTTNDAPDTTEAMKVLLPDPRVEDVAVVDTPPVVLNNTQHFDLIGLEQHKGLIQPVTLDGRLPETPDEIALGVRTIREAHAHIGSTVSLYISAINPIPAQFKVVGTVVVPPYSDTARMGDGAVALRAATPRMAPPNFPLPPSSDLYVTFAPGVNKKAIESELTKKFGQDYSIDYAQRPTDLVNFGQVQNLPLLLAGLVALLAAATFAHTLVTSIRRRRRDLAILKTLGFVPSQVRWAVAWQATTFVSVALLIGIPAGIAVGRVIWSVFARNLGALPEPIVPSVRLLLTVAGAILLGNLIAAIPAIMASRIRPAPALRAE